MIKTIKIIFGIFIIFLAINGFLGVVRMGTGFAYLLGVLTPTLLLLSAGIYLVYSATKTKKSNFQFGEKPKEKVSGENPNELE